MEKRYNPQALQVAIDGQNLIILNTDEVVDGEPSMLMSVDLKERRRVEDFLRLFAPVLIAAGIDLTKFIPGGSGD